MTPPSMPPPASIGRSLPLPIGEELLSAQRGRTSANTSSGPDADERELLPLAILGLSTTDSCRSSRAALWQTLPF